MQSVSVHVREKGRPAHAVPFGCAAKQAGNHGQNVPRHASDRSRGLGMWPRTVQGQPVEGVGG